MSASLTLLDGLDTESVAWLLNSDGTTSIPSLESMDRVIHFTAADTTTYTGAPKEEILQYNLLMIMEKETPDYALGRLSKDFPAASRPGRRLAVENRFHLRIRDGVVECRCSFLYEDGLISLGKLLLNPDRTQWGPLTQLSTLPIGSKVKPEVTMVESKLTLINPNLVTDGIAVIPPNQQALLNDRSVPPFQRFYRCAGHVTLICNRSVTLTHHDNFKATLNTSHSHVQYRTSGSRLEQAKFEYMVDCLQKLKLTSLTPDELIRRRTEMEHTVPDMPELALWDAKSDTHAATAVANLNTSAFCSHCGAVFARAYDRNRHVKNVHLRQRQYECPNCSSRFLQHSHLRDHIEAIHEQKRDSLCTLCGRSFATKYKLKRHVRSVHYRERPHCCNLCDASYFQSSDLVRHMNHKHPGSLYDKKPIVVRHRDYVNSSVGAEECG